MRNLENLKGKRFFFLAGKGGVGKTTTSLALGLFSAKEGKKTLVVSLDPAHSLSIATKGEVPSPPKTYRNLSILEIDVEKEMKNYLERVKKEAEKIVSPVIIGEIEKQIDIAYYSPGAFELAITDAMYKVIERYSSNYDRIIFDTAPSGYTLRLVTVPELLISWLENLIKLRKKALKLTAMAGLKEVEKDPLLEVLERRLKEAKLLRRVFTSRETSFIVVVNPEKLPIEIGKRTIEEFERCGINVECVVLNKWKRGIPNPFPKKKTILIEKQEEEPIGLERLKLI